MKYKKKILIFGGSGLAGLNFIKLFSKKYKILASYNLNKPKISEFENVQFLKIDILSPYKEIKKQVKLFKPNYVFNFSAISEVDLCEKNKKFCKKILFEGFKKGLNKIGIIDLGLSRSELMQMEFNQLVKITQKEDHTKLEIYQLSEFIFCVIISQIFLFLPLILIILGINYL